MANLLTVVMYHYVRDADRSNTPGLKGLDIEEFRGQLAYFDRHHRVVGVSDVLSALDGIEPLPADALLLTFDDGYSDHFDYVLPELVERGWSGAFFPSASAVQELRLLDVNKIQLALAAAPDPSQVVTFVRERIDKLQGRPGVPTYSELYAQYSRMSRFDSPDVTATKRLLQRGLPDDIRSALVDELFTRFVNTEEQTLASELYLTTSQIRTMIEAGMYIGSHGYSHLWLDSIPPALQRQEIEQSLTFLDSVGAPTDRWAISYPYGGYNQSLLDLLPPLNGRLGFTTRAAVADLGADSALTLPRLDTIVLPFSPNAPQSSWTARAP